MREVSIPTMGTMPSFTVPQTDSDYAGKRLDHVLCLLLEGMSENGFKLAQAQESDFEAAETAFDGFSEYLKTWLVTNAQNAEDGVAITDFDNGYIPELITFVVFALTGNWGGIFVLFVKVGLDFLLHYLKEKLKPNNKSLDINDAILQGFFVESEDGERIPILPSLGNIQVNLPTDEVLCCTDWTAYKE
jgi:hypothetical protein